MSVAGLLLPAVAIAAIAVLWWRRSALELARRARSIVDAANALRASARDDYICASHVRAWRSVWSGAIQHPLTRNEHWRLGPSELKEQYRLATEVVADVDEWVIQRNQRYVDGRVLAIRSWCDTRFGHPLTEQQRRAIVVDEDCNLVVAGAGTGKTATILAKIGWLTEIRGVPPAEVLVLAFNKTVAAEIRARALELGLQQPEISTFHAKGFDILGKTEGRKPAISALATDRTALLRFLQAKLERPTPTFLRQFARWWVDRRVEVSDLKSESADERLRKERSIGLRTLNGTLVASQSEVKVADWLTLQGMAWQYEAKYPHSPPSDRRDYTPDFHLLDHGLWLEVWACDETETRFPPEIDHERYREGMAWKRDLHVARGTTLIQVNQNDIWGGRLSQILEEKLVAAGAEVSPLSEAAVRAIVAQTRIADGPFVGLVATFLELYRGGGWTREAVEARATTVRDKEFLAHFWPFLADYEQAVADEGKIDFHEMLIRSARELEGAGAPRSYRYILVDEFQDVSRSRLRLISGLRGTQNGDCRLFLVGDDWQSIYRFTGADIDFFTRVEHYLGTTARTDLDQTFRLLSDVSELSTQFVLRNAAQLKKSLTARAVSQGSPGVAIRFHGPEQESDAMLSVLGEIEQHSGPGAEVLILGRYNHRLPEVPPLVERGSVRVRALTIHRSKGLEADHVVVLGMESGHYGFPSEIGDDRVLRLVLSSEERFPNAEERRLFYVALTRTRGRVYLLADAQQTSPFVQELLGDEYAAWIDLHGEESERHRCPRCQGKTIRRRVGNGGPFWGCINFSACRGKLPICPSCGVGVLRQVSSESAPTGYSCTQCDKRASLCPRCNVGALIEKTGPYGTFMGCSEWRRDGGGCGFTVNRQDA